MDVYIKKDPIVNRLTNYMRDCEEANDTLAAQVFQDCICEIMDEKEQNVAPVLVSKWKYFRKKNMATCMNCSFERNLDVNFGSAVCCPNCGARMV